LDDYFLWSSDIKKKGKRKGERGICRNRTRSIIVTVRNGGLGRVSSQTKTVLLPSRSCPQRNIYIYMDIYYLYLESMMWKPSIYVHLRWSIVS